MLETLKLSFPITAASLIVLGVLCFCARWLAEVTALHLPKRMNHEWEAEAAELRGEEFTEAAPRLRDAMKAVGMLPHVVRSHLGGSSAGAAPEPLQRSHETPESHVSGSKVDLWQLVADAIALCGPFAAVFAHKTIDLQSLLVALLCWATATVIIIDRDHFLIPDAITMPLLWVGLLANTLSTYQDCRFAIASAAGAYLALWVIDKLFMMLRGVQGIGMGDAKWLAVAGAWFGATASFYVLIGACLAGIVYAIASKKERIAFGPMLSIATVVAGITALQ